MRSCRPASRGTGRWFEKLQNRRVGKANGSRECAPDDKFRLPTVISALESLVGTARRAHLPILCSRMSKWILAGDPRDVNDERCEHVDNSGGAAYVH